MLVEQPYPQAAWNIAEMLQKVRSDAVHVNLPTRPPAETWVQPPRGESLIQVLAILGSVATVVHPAEGSFDLSGYDTVMDAIIGIITRHPMRQDELERTLEKWSPGQVRHTLNELQDCGRAQLVVRYGMRF